MGFYINPPDNNKEQWLKANGQQVDPEIIEDFWSSKKVRTHLPVCWVDNGPFTAAGIAFSPDETKAFMHPCGRPKRWYLVPREKLVPYYPKAMELT